MPLLRCLALAIFLLAASISLAEVYDFVAEPLPGDTYTTAYLRLFVPDSLTAARGVYFYVDPYNCDSRYIVENEHFRDLACGCDFTLMGARLDNVHMESGIGEAVLRALRAFAIMSDHPELAFTTLFFDGWSWGGQFSYHFTRWNPERTIGFITQKGGYHDSTAAGAAIQVPGYMFIGELDLPYRITNLTGIFEHHRPLGAPWALAMQPGAGHARIMDRTLLDAYFHAVITERLPDSIPPDQPVELQRIDSARGWLGNRSTHEIGAYTCYGPGIGMASWLPTRLSCEHWQAFVSDSSVTDTIACDAAGIHPAADSDLLRCRPNPCTSGASFTYRVPQAGPVALEIFDVRGARVARLAGDSRAAGSYTAFWDGRDALGRPMGSGIYTCLLRLPGRDVSRRLVRLE